jgi:IclR family KDG regulon transcriptional repressor
MRNPARASTHSSLERALVILEALADKKDGMTVTELAHTLGCHKSTTSRLLITLDRYHYVQRDPKGRYSLGLKVLTLAHRRLSDMAVQRESEPVVRELVETCRETGSVAVLDRSDIVYLYRLKAQPGALLNTPVGARAPAHCTALGKVLLAEHTPDEVYRFLGDGPYPAYTERTITDLETFLRELEIVRAQQYAVNDQEHRPGQACIAAPIRDHTGMTIAGISLSGPAYRIKERFETLLQYLRAAAETLSSSLGYEPRLLRMYPTRK